jgi:glycosyltransferase involved in cell wall biosynthesis
MKVLMLAEFLHPHVGGVEKHIFELNKILTAWGHEVVLWAPKHDNSLPEFEENSGVSVHRVPKTSSKRRDTLKILAWWSKHSDLIRSADRVHFHGSYPLFHWFFPFRLFFPMKPMSITFHGCGMTVPVIRREKLRNRLAQCLTRGNISIGHFLEKWHRLKPTFVSYGGVNIPSNIPSERAKTAVYVGRLDEDMGVEVYIRALKVLRDEYEIEIPLTVCGDGTLKGELEKYCSEYGLDVTFEGFVDNPMDYLLHARYAFVSGYLSILEAMAARCLVFAVYQNKIKEDYLRLMPGAERMMIMSSESHQLAEKLNKAWEDETTFHETREGGFDFAQNQTWEQLAKTYLKLWESP